MQATTPLNKEDILERDRCHIVYLTPQGYRKCSFVANNPDQAIRDKELDAHFAQCAQRATHD